MVIKFLVYLLLISFSVSENCGSPIECYTQAINILSTDREEMRHIIESQKTTIQALQNSVNVLKDQLDALRRDYTNRGFEHVKIAQIPNQEIQFWYDNQYVWWHLQSPNMGIHGQPYQWNFQNELGTKITRNEFQNEINKKPNRDEFRHVYQYFSTGGDHYYGLSQQTPAGYRYEGPQFKVLSP